MADRLRELQEELGRGLEIERDRARREEELAGLGRRRRDQERERIGRLIDGDGPGRRAAADRRPRQPAGDRRGGARALQGPGRRAAADRGDVPRRPFARLGVELELAVIERALRSHRRLPEGLYLALNVSPTVLGRSELESAVARNDHAERPLVVELTEHQPVEDYGELTEALGRLRAHGVRVAVDDVGSGFASFRHVTRVNPEILKLDRSLVCGIDDDPVRQSLAAAIVSFARDIGAIVVSEGIESEGELTCVVDLAIGCGQGFYLGRPALGRVDALCRCSPPRGILPARMIVDCAVYEDGCRCAGDLALAEAGEAAQRDGVVRVARGLRAVRGRVRRRAAAGSTCTSCGRGCANRGRRSSDTRHATGGAQDGPLRRSRGGPRDRRDRDVREPDFVVTVRHGQSELHDVRLESRPAGPAAFGTGAVLRESSTASWTTTSRSWRRSRPTSRRSRHDMFSPRRLQPGGAHLHDGARGARLRDHTGRAAIERSRAVSPTFNRAEVEYLPQQADGSLGSPVRATFRRSGGFWKDPAPGFPSSRR